MLNSAIVEVIIGLIFVFSLASVIVTQINGVITSIFNTRARHLKAGIEDMLTDPVVRTKFLAHPLIRMISPEITPDQRLSAQAAESAASSEPQRVTSIPPALFSQALIDVISATASIVLYAGLQEVIERDLDGGEKAQMRELLRRLQAGGIGIQEFRNAINDIDNARKRLNLVQALGRVEAMRNDLQSNNESSKLIPLMEGLRYIENQFFRKGMETLLAPARTLPEASAKIEFWFSARMEQLSQQYRRKMAQLSLAVGLVLTMIFNIDALYIARTLWDDPALRAAVALAAQDAVSSGQLQTQIQEAQAVVQSTPTPTPEPVEVMPAPEEVNDAAGAATIATPVPTLAFSANAQVTPRVEVQPTVTIPDLIEEVSTVSDTVFTLLNLRLPMGWDYQPIAAGCPSPATLIPDPCAESRNLWNYLPGNNPNWVTNVLVKILGWFVTVIAISQGAPFWFDLLNRIATGRRSDT
ncbi:MAG: hypothetical protein ACUVS2_00435 [Candidatus Flexifilum sp.]